MTTEPVLNSLVGHCLIAMPDMPDPRFQGSLIFICAHSPEGAMGLIVNKPIEGVQVADVMEQLSIKGSGAPDGVPVHYGGPVESGRGFVLHSPDYLSELSSMPATQEFVVTATLDVLEEIADGEGPKHMVFALGYSGWGEGQLEAELAANGWLTVEASPELIFDTPDADKWSHGLRKLGIDPAILSLSGGSA